MRPLLVIVRIGLPGAIALAGIVLIVIGHGDMSALGVVLVGVAILVVLANLLIRLSISSQRDREREQAERRRRWHAL
jgi:hypothetical protein